MKTKPNHTNKRNSQTRRLYREKTKINTKQANLQGLRGRWSRLFVLQAFHGRHHQHVLNWGKRNHKAFKMQTSSSFNNYILWLHTHKLTHRLLHAAVVLVLDLAHRRVDDLLLALGHLQLVGHAREDGVEPPLLDRRHRARLHGALHEPVHVLYNKGGRWASVALLRRRSFNLQRTAGEPRRSLFDGTAFLLLKETI